MSQQLNPEMPISEPSFKILSIPQTITKPHLAVFSNPEQEDLNSSYSLNRPPTDLKSLINVNNEIKSITQLNSKHNKEFFKAKSVEVSKHLTLKSNIAESQRSGFSPAMIYSREDALSQNDGLMAIPQENCKSEDSRNTLDFSFRKTSQLSIDFHLVHRGLVDLNLSYNELAEFPKQILELNSLRFLKLDFNKITVLPSEISQLSQIEFFSVSNNRITRVPESILQLQSLKCLNIGKNLLRIVPLELTLLSSLEVLYIYGNLLETFPSSFQNLTNLKELAFEWLNYTIPAIDTIIKRTTHPNVFNRLMLLCKEMEALRIEEISFINFIQSLSSNAIDFLKSDSKLRNMLHIASLKDEISVIYNLTKEFPSLLDQVDKESQTPLTLALLENKPRSISLLLDLGADPRKGGGHLGSALHLSAFKLDVPLIDRFLRGGCCPNALDFDRNTALHLVFSIFSKQEEDSKRICELLMAAGCNPNVRNKDNWTPLHLAVKRMQIKAIHWAVDYNKRLRNNNPDDKRLFNFNKRGGTHKFSPIHLATHQSHIGLMEALFEGDSDMFLETDLFQIPKDLSYNSLLLVKVSRKLEGLWLKAKFLRKKGYQQGQIELNVGNMKSKIEKTLNKQNSSVFGAEELKNINKLNKPEERPAFVGKEVGRDLKIKSDRLIMPNFLCNLVEEPVIDPESQRQSDDENLEEVEDLEEFNGTTLLKANNEVFSRNITHGFNNISELNSRQPPSRRPLLLSPLERHLLEPSDPNQCLFFQSPEIMKSLDHLSLKHYLPEIKQFIQGMTEYRLPLDEKLKCLWLLKLLHYRIVNYHRKYVSRYLPCCVYVLNEFYSPLRRCRDIPCDQSEYVPSVLMKVYERLLENPGEEKPVKENKPDLSSNMHNILRNNLDDCAFFDSAQLSSLKLYEKRLLLQELNRVFAEFSYKRSKSTLKSIIRTPWINKLNSYEAIQSLLFLLYYRQPPAKLREKSVPSGHLGGIAPKKGSMVSGKELAEEAKAFIKTLEEETPIKRSNITAIKSRYKENMLMKNPFGGQSQQKHVENVNEDEANDVMELHLEKYFPNKCFQTPFHEEFKQNAYKKG